MIRSAIIYGTRPEAIKLAPLSKKLDEHDGFENVAVFTGQHEKHAQDLFEHLSSTPSVSITPPNRELSITSRMGETLRLLDNEKIISADAIDLVLIQGDTLTSFAGAMHGFMNGIKVGHVEAGLRTNTHLRPFPEEGFRRMITQISDFHFAPTQRALQVLLGTISPTQKAFMVGNTVIDAVKEIDSKIEKRPLALLEKNALITVHRRENWSKLKQIADAIRDLSLVFEDWRFLWVMHPNPSLQKDLKKTLREVPNISLLAPMDYKETIQAISLANIIFTDSGGIQEESTFYGKPILVLREETERMEVLEAGNGILVGSDRENIFTEASRLMANTKELQSMSFQSFPYGRGYSSEKIISAILAELHL